MESPLIRMVCMVGLTLISTTAACSAPFDITGVVLESGTRTPLSGAYVVAIYEEPVRSTAVSTHRCVKLKGMTTGSDGRFRFPVEKLDGESPSAVVAIKPGYFLDRLGGEPDPDAWRRQTKEAYANREIYLSAQDERKPQLFSYSTDGVFCADARTRADAQPGAEYLRISLGELRKYAASRQQISSVEYLIRRLEGLPQ